MSTIRKLIFTALLSLPLAAMAQPYTIKYVTNEYIATDDGDSDAELDGAETSDGATLAGAIAAVKSECGSVACKVEIVSTKSGEDAAIDLSGWGSGDEITFSGATTGAIDNTGGATLFLSNNSTAGKISTPTGKLTVASGFNATSTTLPKYNVSITDAAEDLSSGLVAVRGVASTLRFPNIELKSTDWAAYVDRVSALTDISIVPIVKLGTPTNGTITVTRSALDGGGSFSSVGVPLSISGTVTLTQTPSNGYEFDAWDISGGTVDNGPPIILTLPAAGSKIAPIVISATFKVADPLNEKTALTAAMFNAIPAQTYSGSQLTPTVASTPTAGLTIGDDFTVSYGANINAGTNVGTATVTGAGEYEGTVTLTFTINKLSITIIPTTTPFAITYPAALSTITPTGNHTDVGDYLWVNDATIPTVGTTTARAEFALDFTNNGNYTLVGGVEDPYGIFRVAVDMPIAVSKGTLMSIDQNVDVEAGYDETIDLILPAAIGTTGLSYTIGTPTDGDNIITGTVTRNGITLNVSIANSANAGEIATIPVTIANPNYNDVVINVIVKVSSDVFVVFGATSEQRNPTYNGSPISPTFIVQKRTGGDALDLIDVDPTITYTYGTNTNVSTGPTNAGAYTATITAGTGYVGTFTISGTVGKLTLTTSSFGAITDLTYDGTAQFPVPALTAVFADVTLAVNDTALTYTNNTNAGNGTVTVTAGTSENITGTAYLSFTIKKAEIATLTFPSSFTYSYDGKTLGEKLETATGGSADGAVGAAPSVVAGSGILPIAGGTFEWETAATKTTVPNAGPATNYSMKFMPDVNHVLSATAADETPANVSVSVSKNTSLTNVAQTYKVEEGAYTYTVPLKLPTATGSDIGRVFAASVTDNSDDILNDAGVEVTGTSLTLPIKASAVKDEGAEVTVSVESTNYTDYDIVITVEVTDKTPVEIAYTLPASLVYSGTAKTPTVVIKTNKGGTTVPAADYTITYSPTGTPINAGNYSFSVAFDDPDEYEANEDVTAVVFVIAKRPVTITAPNINLTQNSTFASADHVNGITFNSGTDVGLASTLTAADARALLSLNYTGSTANAVGTIQTGALSVIATSFDNANYIVTTVAGDVTIRAGATYTVYFANATATELDGVYTITARAPTCASTLTFNSWSASPSVGTFADASAATTTYTPPGPLTQNVTVTANFPACPSQGGGSGGGVTPPSSTYSIVVTSGAGGTARADKSAASYQTRVTLSATPDEGYRFKRWISSTSIPNSFMATTSFEMPARAVSIQAEFELDNSYAVAVTSGAGGTATASASTATYLAKVTLTATPSDGYRFKEWVVKSGDVVIASAKSATTEFAMPPRAVAIEATFEEGSSPIIARLTTSAGPVMAHAINGGILLQNLPQNAKVEVYSLQGKIVHSANTENSQTLKIQARSGMYIVKINGNAMRVAVK